MKEVAWKVTGGRDLHASLECSCPSPLFADSDVAHLMKTRITLSGYADDNFFDNVNASPRLLSCPTCNRQFTERWRRDGIVEIQEL